MILNWQTAHDLAVAYAKTLMEYKLKNLSPTDLVNKNFTDTMVSDYLEAYNRYLDDLEARN